MYYMRVCFEDDVIAARAAEEMSLIIAIVSNGFARASIPHLSYSSDCFGTLVSRFGHCHDFDGRG